jgi:hypothetical protein
MDKKYTFFISSTFTDLAEERDIIAKLVLDFDEIPVGMEQFGSVDVDQWVHIKRLIDSADYYVLVVAGKYGSIDVNDADGISYTHKEFRYARDSGVPVIAILHGSPDDLPLGRSEEDPVRKAKLESFRHEVKRGRLVSFYKDQNELAKRFSAGFVKAKTNFLRPGWIRNVNLLPEDKVKGLVVNLQERLKLSEKINSDRGVEIALLKNKIQAQNPGASDKVEDITKPLNFLDETRLINLTWIDGNNTGEISINVPNKSMFIMVAMLIIRGELRKVYQIPDIATGLADHIARVHAKEYTGEGTKFTLFEETIFDFVTDSITEKLLETVDGRLAIAEIGTAYLDWND